ncbi:TADA2A family protein [Megaselia abdita]
MSFMNLTDLVEEDAADLQFPKDMISLSNNNQTTMHRIHFFRQTISPNSEKSCHFCFNVLAELFIECAECNSVFLCLNCFSQGKEIENHQKSHSYVIVHDNIRVFSDSDWTAKEEKLLLELIASFGYGNWDDISLAIKTRSSAECQEHYTRFYFDGVFGELLGLTNEVYRPLRTPFLLNLNKMNSNSYVESMAGYRAARGDFDIPYDNSAEAIINDLDGCFYGDWLEVLRPLGEKLQCAMLRAYNHKLRERHRRYKIIRDHGLLISSKTMGCYAQYVDAFDSVEKLKANKNINGNMLSFMQLTNPTSFDKLLEGMQQYSELNKYISKLYDCRKNGVTTLAGGKLYFKLRNKKVSLSRDKKILQYKELINWRDIEFKIKTDEVKSTSSSIMIPCVNHLRKKASPMDVIGLPSYEKLSEAERKLCSIARISPLSFLEYKELLTSEHKNIGYLKLADARRLIKIDVNKTRQIYDFLLKNGQINTFFV